MGGPTSCPAVRDIWNTLIYLGSRCPGGREYGDQHEPDGGDAAKHALDKTECEKQRQMIDKPHDEKDDAVAENTGLEKELGPEACGQASPEGRCERGNQG